MAAIIVELRRELKKNVDPKIKESGKRFFKEKINVYGVNTAVAIKIGKTYFGRIKDKDKKEIFLLCEDLLKSGVMEEAFIAFLWSEGLNKLYKPADFKVFERWLKNYVDNWAECDTLCNHTVGDFIDMYPEFIDKLKKWAKSKDRWVKRGAAVSLIIPARNGKFLKDIFEIADILLMDEDDMVQKGYGWMLKAASEAHQKEVFAYVVKNKGAMPRTALRYAIEKMPAEMKKEAMAK